MSSRTDNDNFIDVPPPPKSARITRGTMDSDDDSVVTESVSVVSGRGAGLYDDDKNNRSTVKLDSEEVFSESHINDPVTIIIVADKGVGKTTLAASLFESFCKSIKIDAGIVLTSSDDPTYFSNILPEDRIIRKHEPRIVALNIMRIQKQIQSNQLKDVARVCVVFDDVFNTSADFKGMEDFFRNANVANVLPIYTVSDPSIIPKSLQDRTDFVFIARSMKHGTRSKCWKTFGDMYENFSDFNDALSRLGTHSFLAIDKTSRSSDVNDIVSCYTPYIKESTSITFEQANAFGKWHLLTDKACRHSTIVSDDTSGDDIELMSSNHFAIKDNLRSDKFYEMVRASLHK